MPIERLGETGKPPRTHERAGGSLETIIELAGHRHGNERSVAEKADRNSGNNGQNARTIRLGVRFSKSGEPTTPLRSADTILRTPSLRRMRANVPPISLGSPKILVFVP